MALPVFNPASTSKPTLLVKEIQDIYVRKNFDNLVQFFAAQNQLLNFQFYELTFSEAQENYTFQHGLGFVPKDIIVLQCTGAGEFQFNVGLCSQSEANVTVTGPCNVRFFLGSYWKNQNSTFQNAESDVMIFNRQNTTSKTTANVKTYSQVYTPLTSTDLASKIYDSRNTALVYFVRTTDEIMYCSPTASGFTFYLPKASDCVGQKFTFIKTDQTFNPVLVATNPNSSDYLEAPYTQNPITGAVNLSTLKNTGLATYLERLTLISTGTFWRILERDYYKGWTYFTQTVANFAGNLTVNQAMWRRDGNHIEIWTLQVKDATAAAGGFAVIWYPPAGLTMDANAFPGTLSTLNTNYQVVGQCSNAQSGVHYQVLWLGTGGSNNVYLYNTSGQFNGVNFSANCTLSLRYKVPINGWNS